MGEPWETGVFGWGGSGVRFGLVRLGLVRFRLKIQAACSNGLNLVF